ncbi:hypothetical protein [Acrocarpospora sp. B8E8]|uniref:hypothetical protein n=1 Tax=Acrocarpospora sp. B8E8 TaxID=3153572 RepID=UPI00325DCAC4
MTPEQAADRAAEVLTKAEDQAAVYPETATALVAVADGWVRLAQALRTPTAEAGPVQVRGNADPAAIAEELRFAQQATAPGSDTSDPAPLRLDMGAVFEIDGDHFQIRRQSVATLPNPEGRYAKHLDVHLELVQIPEA